MVVVSLDAMEQARMELIKFEEEKIEKGGLERGELKPRLEEIAKNTDLSYYTIKNLYYQQIKDNVEEGTEIKVSTNNHNTLLLDGKEIRYTQKGKTFFPLNDILAFLNASRASKITKKIIDVETEEKEYLNFKNGYNTLVMDTEKLKTLLNEFMIEGTIENQTKANTLYGFLKEEGLFDEEENSEYSLEDEEINEEEKVEEETKEESMENPHTETVIQQEKVLDTYTYVSGSQVEVVILKILPYGLIVETTDERKTTGLIHISEIKDSYIVDLNPLFNVGDVLHARVKGLDKGNLSLSTKKMSLTPLRNVFENESKNEKEEYKKHENPPINSLYEKFQGVDLHSMFEKESEGQPVEKEEVTVKQIAKKVNEDEIKEIISFLNGVVGALSPKAKEKLEELTSKHLIFKLTMKMMKVAEGFENDPGLKFLKEVEKELGDSL